MKTDGVRAPRRIAAALIAAVLVAGCGGSKDSANDDIVLTPTDRTASEPGIPVNQVSEGKPLPKLNLTDGSGRKVSTESLLGKTPLVINYWFSTCRPCKKELPDFASVDQEMAGKVRFIGVNGFDTPEENESFARKLGVKYDLFLDPNGDYTKALGLGSAPVTIFVTADGTIVKQVGEVNAEQLRTIINEKLLTQ